MKSILVLLIACGALLSGCAVMPYDDGYGGGQGNGCPPGQAKRGIVELTSTGTSLSARLGKRRRDAADWARASCSSPGTAQ
ncbi:hypothetical protein [Cupriavidus basilensis]